LEEKPLSKKHSAVRNYTEFFLFRLVSGLVSRLPAAAAWFFGKALGKAMHLTDRRHRGVAARNLAAAFPQMPPDEIRRRVKKVFEHIGLLVVESLQARKMLARGIENFVEKPDLSKVSEALDAGRGLIVATAHIGNWEIAGHATSVMITPLNSVARPLDNPLIEKYVDSMRRLSGQKIIGKRGAVRDMVRSLNAGEAIAVLMDQDARRHGVFVNFFGRPASTWPTVAALALKHGCPIVFGFARRTARFQYELIADHVFRPEPTGDRDADIRDLTQKITSRIEERIRETPEQWFWVHRRWKTQPPPEDERRESEG